ncbi:MAG: 4-(cytidine 5'-diphospho)-2-C-methyl-D-erythritol kinase [Proteobacteria bacterium]|nr:4-(cytidine 5'-diphospho)-2-C-methyl-D-erythritol kinase [Pseudomonadota bacterium]
MARDGARPRPGRRLARGAARAADAEPRGDPDPDPRRPLAGQGAVTGPRWLAPAKLNLFLHVLGRRADGYHELETLFELVDLCDEIEIRPRQDGVIERLRGPADVPPEADLAVRAARRLREAAGDPSLGCDLMLDKRIPAGGGLGGGSSDAATVLVALDALWGLDWPAERLKELAAGLGADVPVFVGGETAIGRGIGERLEPAAVAPRAYAIVFPGVPAATASAFQAAELTRNSPALTIPGSLYTIDEGASLPGRNDLEPVVAARHPAVRAALAWLGARGNARLTGSGASVFAPFRDRRAAAAALAGLPAGWLGFAVEGLARSPLLAQAAAVRAARTGGGRR